ncbi:maker209 [Drosophila busckii]|uniref:Maker209 n=1 Tax=Drosophila busckii TaxID=30019 RepID=A0A0M3QY12_DROBS|nr:maker209 [Drosophila busckii]
MLRFLILCCLFSIHLAVKNQKCDELGTCLKYCNIEIESEVECPQGTLCCLHMAKSKHLLNIRTPPTKKYVGKTPKSN